MCFCQDIRRAEAFSRIMLIDQFSVCNNYFLTRSGLNPPLLILKYNFWDLETVVGMFRLSSNLVFNAGISSRSRELQTSSKGYQYITVYFHVNTMMLRLYP